MPTHVWDAIDVKRELVLHHLIHLRRWRNIIASPFFRLPTELILDIFVHAVELNRRARFWVILTAVCHRLREMLIHSSLPWSVVDTDSIRLAKLFLERNRFDPHVLFATNYSWFPKVNTRRAALWEELEGRTFNNLRLLVFRGPRREFDHRVVDLLRRTPNLSSLEIGTSIRMTWDLEWPSGDQLPHLTMLRLSHVRISWAAPLLRNLTKLILNFICTGTPHESTSIQTFLNALKNCPDLESLQLAFAGPDLPDNNQGDSKVVVRLRKLQILVLQFDDQKVVECILSHIWFPESTKVEVETSCHAGLYAAISQVLPLPNVETSQYLRRTGVVTINFNVLSYELATDNFHFVLLQSHDEGESHRLNMNASPQFASKVVEIIGGDTVVSLHVLLSLPYDIPRGMWKELLYGFPHLEEISYSTSFQSGRDSADPFFSVFSESFEGGPVCPQLWDLKIPRVFTQGSSAVALRRALLERDACGRRLKRISLSHPAEDEILVLRPFRDVVDDVAKFQDLRSWFSQSLLCSWPLLKSSFFPSQTTGA